MAWDMEMAGSNKKAPETGAFEELILPNYQRE
jgi:hypothetical protein